MKSAEDILSEHVVVEYGAYVHTDEVVRIIRAAQLDALREAEAACVDSVGGWLRAMTPGSIEYLQAHATAERCVHAIEQLADSVKERSGE